MGLLNKLFGIAEKPPAEVHVINDQNFRKEVLESPVPVLLDVWSDGCGPCKMLIPVVMELSREYHGRLKVAELNIATGMQTARKYGISGTPTVLYFHKGRVTEKMVGYRPRHYHQQYLDQELLPRIEGRTAS